MKIRYFLGVIFFLLLCVDSAHADRKSVRKDDSRGEWGALPTLSYSSDIGMGVGAIVSFAQLDPLVKPYRFRLELLLYMTIKEKAGGDGYELPYHDDYLKLDLPGLWNGKLRLNIEFSFARYTTSGYYGFGNDAPYDARLEEAHPRYYQYDRIYPSLSIAGRLHLFKKQSLLLGLRGSYNWINPYDQSLLKNDIERGDARTTRLLAFNERFFAFNAIVGWVYDSRDHEYMPAKGVFHEVSLRLSPGWLTGLEHGYGGGNLTLRFYQAVIKNYLTFAFRAIFDALVGEAPFFELARHGGLFESDAIGGAKAVRGVPLQRYHGKIKAFANLEMRSRFLHFKLGNESFALGALLFCDAGRTWADWTNSDDLDGDGLGLKWGLGGGLRFFWGESFIIRADIAYAKEADPIGFYIDVNHIF